MTSANRVVLVVGPPLAGVSGVVEALRAHLTDAVVVDADGLVAGRAPDAVVAVVSAVAPLTRSDWALIARAAARTELVIGVVSKIDAHRCWREVVEADRALVAAWDRRYGSMTWLGVAAAPGLGAARVGELVDVLHERLADPLLDSRNRLRDSRSRQFAERGTRATRAPARGNAFEMRRVLQGMRLRLLRFVRDGCSELRAELRDAASMVGVGGSEGFETLVKARARAFDVEVADEITRAVEAAATELGMADLPIPPEPVRSQSSPDVSRTPSSSRRLEGRLMTVLGLGFGMGIALASSRLLAGVAPGLSAAGSAAGAVAGLALVVWVVRARGLLHDRALLDRWVGEVAATLRHHGEAMVAERLLGAESAWVAAKSPAAPKGALERASGDGFVDAVLTRIDVTDQYEWC